MSKRAPKSLLSPNTNYFVLFHSNSCGGCVAFKPTWAELQKHKNKVGATMIAIESAEFSTVEKDPHLGQVVKQLRYVPTMVMYSGDTKSFEEYNSERDVQTILNVLKQKFPAKKPAAKKVQVGGECGVCSAGLPIMPVVGGGKPVKPAKKRAAAKPKTRSAKKTSKKVGKQAGGFVRGGVILPESFYTRS